MNNNTHMIPPRVMLPPSISGSSSPSSFLGQLQGICSANIIESNIKMAPDQSNDALMASMKKLFETGSYSDLTIVCGVYRYKVHKAIICPRSGFFAGACESIFQESQTGVINLPEDDPLAVKLMLHYLYHQDYSHETLACTEASSLSLASITPLDSAEDLSPRKKRRLGSPTPLTLSPPVPTPTLSGLSLHVKVYALAEKYAIEDLKAVALDKFRTEAKQHWQSQDFVDVIQEVYTSTVEHDRGLRDVLVDVICQHMELLDIPSFQDAVKDHRVSFDVLMYSRLVKPHNYLAVAFNQGWRRAAVSSSSRAPFGH